jgi:hypothetical protein
MAEEIGSTDILVRNKVSLWIFIQNEIFKTVSTHGPLALQSMAAGMLSLSGLVTSE